MSDFKRMYHPTLNQWHDVPSGDVKGWTEQGWKATRPKHVDDSVSLPVGEGFVASLLTDEVADAAHPASERR